MTPGSAGSADGLGKRTIIYSHLSLKPQKFPSPYQLFDYANLQLPAR